MPAWPGGPCPNCGEEMPPRLLRCRTCRHLLNRDLKWDSVEIPTFQPLQEMTTEPSLRPRGVFLPCPACDRELRVNGRFCGQMVRCKHCQAGFQMPATLAPQPNYKAYYADCPHCHERLKLATKYLGQRVACRFCGGKIDFDPPG